MANIKSLDHRALKKRTLFYIISAIILTSMVWMLAYSVITDEKDRQLKQSAEQAKRTAIFFERHTLDFFSYGDSYLKMIRNEYLRNYNLEDISQLMLEVPLNTSIASHVTVIDESGVPVLNSGHKIKPGSTAQDRDYFLFQKNAEGDQLMVSLPHRGRNSDKLIIRLVRGFNKLNGEFGGVIFVALEAKQITQFFNAINLGPKSSATLVGTDKKIRARSSYGRLGPGQDISGSVLWQYVEKSPTGLYRQLSVVDGITRNYAYRKLSEYPLIAVIGVSSKDVESATWQSQQPVYLAAILASILITTTVLLMLREINTNRKLSLSENRISTIVETVHEGIISINQNGVIDLFNSGAQKMFGYERDQAVGQHISMLSNGYDKKQVDQYIKDYLSLSDEVSLVQGGYREVSVMRKDGTLFPVELSIGEMQRGKERIFVATLRDISEKMRTQKELFEARERAQVTLQSIGDAVISTDAGGHVDFLNSVAEKLTGWNAEQAKGRLLNEVFRIKDEFTGIQIPDPIQRCLSEGKLEGLTGNTVLISRSGVEYAIEDSAAPISGDDGKILGVVLVFKDVTEARSLSKKVYYQASHDALTGLINRREFEIRLERIRETAELEDTENVFCYMDLDQFKLVNDTCGHTAGDELLRQMAGLMKSCIRRRDTLGRLGGDEFGLLMEHCSVEEAKRITAKMIEEVGKFSFIWEDNRFKVGISIGLVSIVKGCDGQDGLMRAADSACYTAKEQGRNRLHIYLEEDESLARRKGEMQWAVRLPHALENDRFELYYQTICPLQNATDEEPYQYEVLLRMVDEEQNLVAPGLFLPAAERYNIATDLDKWVIRYMFKWLHANPAHLEKLKYCSINLSGLSLGNKTFLPFVFEQLNRNRIPPHIICFEITETTAITNLTTATGFIKELKELGCLFALDDFGSGLSSFAYLKNLPVDILKIDGLFVKDIIDDPMDLAMVKSINEIGHVMGKKTIAEFVENDAILQKLSAIGVDYAQGYGISKPKPLNDLLNIS